MSNTLNSPIDNFHLADKDNLTRRDVLILGALAGWFRGNFSSECQGRFRWC